MKIVANNMITIPRLAIDGLDVSREMPHDYLTIARGGIYTCLI